MTLRQKKYLIIGFFGTFFLLIIFLVVLPLLQEIAKNAKELKTQKEELVRFQAQLANLRAFKEKYHQSSDIQKIKDFFVNPEVPVAFITFLEEAAKTEKISFEIMALPAIKPEESSLEFLLKGKSAFSNFRNFLVTLEKAPYLIEVEALTLQKPEKDQKESPGDIIDISLSLKVYARAQ
jgi:Tfp pilus assembly protein PilE